MLFDKLKAYGEKGIYPFHMPGHKRNIELMGGDLPYSVDITEIDGFDNLHNPSGVISDIQKLARKAYKCENAFLLVNGSTCGILAAVRAMTSFGDKVIVARNSHKSVYNAIELCGLEPVYIYPDSDDVFGIFRSVAPSQIEAAVNKNPDAGLIIITSPTYEGVVSNVKAIAEIAHNHNIPLFVDEAHGAHFPFSEAFPKEAVFCGADAAVVSLHKTLPSLTQTALLLCSDRFKEKAAENLSIFETSSPSYILMASAERALDFCLKSRDRFDEYVNRLAEFSDFCKGLKNIKVLCCGSDSLNNHKFYDFDISKITVSLRGLKMRGAEFAQIMREKYKTEAEMAYSDYAVFLTSVCDSDRGFEILKTALSEIDRMSEKSPRAENIAYPKPERAFNTFEKFKYAGGFTELNKSVGKVSLEYVWAYPPSIPLITPGEIISRRLTETVIKLSDSGTELFSSKGKIPKEIYTANCD